MEVKTLGLALAWGNPPARKPTTSNHLVAEAPQAALHTCTGREQPWCTEWGLGGVQEAWVWC